MTTTNRFAGPRPTPGLDASLRRLDDLSDQIKARLSALGREEATRRATAAGIKPLDTRYADTAARVAWSESMLAALGE